MAYTHLTLEERHYLGTRHQLKDSTTAMATALGRSQSTVSREPRRNRGQRGYRHQQASMDGFTASFDNTLLPNFELR